MRIIYGEFCQSICWRHFLEYLMNKLFLKFIFYSFVCFYVVAYEANHTSLAATKQEKKVESTDKKLDKQSRPEKRGKSIVKTKSIRFELVPPPPPEQPSFLDLSNMPNLSTSFNLFNDAELKQKLNHLKVQIVNAQDALLENNSQLSEAKEESERFNSLFSDGIVSRKELEAKRKSAIHKEHIVLEAKNNLEDLQLQETAILRRLAQSKKGDKSRVHSFRNKTAKHE